MRPLASLFVGVLLFLPIILFGQKSYKIADIPDSLKENANVVYIVNEASYEIVDETKAIYRLHTVAAILNSKAKRYAVQYVRYDPLTKINSFKGTVYDANGKETKKLKKSDIIDRSNVSGFSIYEDDRIQYADLQQNKYPYIVEFEYEQEFKYTYHIPGWYTMPGQNASVLKSYYKITSPLNMKPNVKLVNSEKDLSIRNYGGKVEIVFEQENLKAIEREENAPPSTELYPILYTSPSWFEYDGYEGSMNTWESYGKWQLELNKGRNDLSNTTKSEIQRITNAFDKREDKIRAVYQYVQDKTRYVSIQLGIGGLQPFPASTVDELGYGDCKALSNYTYSLLESIGIKSHYTKVYGGRDFPKLQKDFPASYFNHIILCVPNEQDTVWLECTNQTNPFGYQGDFTGDRDVMIITDDGGKVVHTTVYDKEVNTQISNVEVTVDKSGQANAQIQIEYAGLQYENYNVDRIADDSEEEQKKWIYENTDIPDFTIDNFSFDTKKDKIPVATQSMKVSIPRLGKPNGKRVFLQPNLLNKSSYIPKKYEERKTDLVLDFQGIDEDKIVYQIPEHLHPEYLPEPVTIESEFGTYSSSTNFENGKLTYVRRMEYNKGRFDKSLYEEYREYRKKVVRADKAKVVFVDKT